MYLLSVFDGVCSRWFDLINLWSRNFGNSTESLILMSTVTSLLSRVCIGDHFAFVASADIC